MIIFGSCATVSDTWCLSPASDLWRIITNVDITLIGGWPRDYDRKIRVSVSAKRDARVGNI